MNVNVVSHYLIVCPFIQNDTEDTSDRLVATLMSQNPGFSPVRVNELDLSIVLDGKRLLGRHRGSSLTALSKETGKQVPMAKIRHDSRVYPSLTFATKPHSHSHISIRPTN